MKKQKSMSTVRNNLFIIGRTFSICPQKVIFDILGQILSKSKMFIFSIFYPLYIYQAVQSATDFSVILRYVAYSMIIILFVDLFNNYYNSYLKPIYEVKIMQSVRHDIFFKRSKLDLESYEDSKKIEELNQVVTNVNRNFLETQSSFFNTIFDALYLLLTIGIMLSVDLTFIPFILLPLLISFALGNKLNIKHYEMDMKLLDHKRKLDYIRNVFFNRSHSKEIKLTNISKPLLKTLASAHDSSEETIKSYGSKIGVITAFMETFGRYIIYIGVIIFVTYKVVVSQSIDIGQFYFLVFSIITLSWYLTSTIKNILMLSKNALYIDNYRNFEMMSVNIEDSGSLTIDYDMDHIIEFRNVSFKYPREESYTLKDVNLRFEAGKKYCIAGFNGAGKTTLMKLLLRFYDVVEGEVLLDGINIKEYKIEEYRKLFGTVFQDYFVYAAELSLNIAMDDDRKEDEVVMAAVNAGIDKKISGLSHGYETQYTRQFDDSGVVFSGGDQQKLALARAFYADRSVTIFDEPTSKLDAIAEKELFTTMLSETKSQISIFISHRLSSATIADKVFYIELGKVIEQGHHTDLTKLNGKYMEAFNAQAHSYR